MTLPIIFKQSHNLCWHIMSSSILPVVKVRKALQRGVHPDEWQQALHLAVAAGGKGRCLLQPDAVLAC